MKSPKIIYYYLNFNHSITKNYLKLFFFTKFLMILNPESFRFNSFSILIKATIYLTKNNNTNSFYNFDMLNFNFQILYFHIEHINKKMNRLLYSIIIYQD